MLKRKPRHMAQGRAVEPSRDYVPRHMKGSEAPLITFGAGPTAGNTERVYRDVPVPPRG